ncbi:MAG: protein kinase [Pyrinomonadaceae bacterium]
MPSLKLEGMLLDDRYEILGRVGSGLFEEIFVARDIRARDSWVYLRCANPSIRGKADVDVKARLTREYAAEAELAQKVGHPHIVALICQGRSTDLSGVEFDFIGYEFCAGGDISALGRRHASGKLNLNELTRYVGQISAALTHAHKFGIFHGRLQPRHLLLTPDGKTIKVTGLGAAQADSFEDIQVDGLQTEVYAPPTNDGLLVDDQARRAHDVYALAKICFAALTGRTPVEFAGRPIDRFPVFEAEMPWGADLLRLLSRATSPYSLERYDSAVEFYRDLAAVADTHVDPSAVEVERKLSPEEKELIRKRGKFAPIEAVLAQRELELTTLQVEMREFEGRYLRLVGTKHAVLDELEAKIAEGNSRLFPDDVEMRIAAQRARSRASESAAAAERHSGNGDSCGVFEPSEKIKKIYRELARLIHPDTVLQADQKERRHVLMSQANRAYEENDFGRLQNMLGDWEHSPEAIKGHGPGAELIRTIRRIDQAEERLNLLAADLKDWERSHVFQLRQQVELASVEGRDHLHEMATRLDQKIREARRRLSELELELTVA